MTNTTTTAPTQNAAAMLDTVMRERRSVRGFLPEPIPQDELERIFTTAQQSPSNCNVQPWVVHVLSGDAAEAMREALHEKARTGTPQQPDFPLTENYPGQYRQRRIDAAIALFSVTGVARDDKEAREASFLRNFRFFDAPHAAFIFIPDWCGMREAADCGMYAQSLMLALTAAGYASCAQGALSWYAPLVRERLGVSDDMHLLFGLAFGREDPAHPANDARTDRASIADAIHFHG